MKRESEAAASERFLFIDGLRGLAALSVALAHIASRPGLEEPALQVLPRPLFLLADYGWLGVQVFFVISGFVIAYSIRGFRMSGRFLGNFALRRAIRLDPPYWATILVVVAVNAASNHFLTDRHVPLPHWRQVASHVLYLQNILGYGDICGVFWTLCIEVQFYLALILLVGLAQRLPVAPRRQLVTVFLPLALASLIWFAEAGFDRAPILPCYLYMFSVGAMACWVHVGAMARGPLYLLLAVVALRGATLHRLEPVVVAATGLAIHLVGLRGRLGSSLKAAPIQYLGRISYSLYLIHNPIGGRLANLGVRLARGSPWIAVASIVASVAASVLAAHLMHRLVEAPSVRFARRFRPPKPALPPILAVAGHASP